jgi:hypothetical protein
LLASHLIQNQLQSDSKESDSVRKGKSRRSLTDKVFRIFLSVPIDSILLESLLVAVRADRGKASEGSPLNRSAPASN